MRTNFDPSLTDQTTQHSPTFPHPSQVKQLGRGGYETRWKRKHLVRKTLKEDKDKFITTDEEIEPRMRRNSNGEHEELSWNASNDNARAKRNYKENASNEGQDRAAIWGLTPSLKG